MHPVGTLQRHLRQLVRRRLDHGIAAVHHYLHRRPAISQAALVIGRDGDAHADLAAPEHVHQLLRAVGHALQVDHAGGGHVHHRSARSGGAGLVHDRGLQVAGIEVDRVAEQQQVHHRDQHDHHHADPVAAHLPQFLQGDGPHPAQVLHPPTPSATSSAARP